MFRETFQEISNPLCSNKEKTDLCFQYFKFEERKQLCKDPYLRLIQKIIVQICIIGINIKLGTFKLEHLNTEPFIEMVHNIKKKF